MKRSVGESEHLVSFRRAVGGQKFGTILASPPFVSRSKTPLVTSEEKSAPEPELTLDDIHSLPVSECLKETAHLYLWVSNTQLPVGLEIIKAWGFKYKSNIIWHKSASEGVRPGYYFRNVTEMLLFGVRGKNARTLKRGRTQVNYLETMDQEVAWKPDEQYRVIEECSFGPFLELFGADRRRGWSSWGSRVEVVKPSL